MFLNGNFVAQGLSRKDMVLNKATVNLPFLPVGKALSSSPVNAVPSSGFPWLDQ